MPKSKSSTDAEIRKLVTARLSVLSKDTVISIGAEGGFTRDELIEKVESGDAVGKKMMQVEMEWLRSFKKELA